MAAFLATATILLTPVIGEGIVRLYHTLHDGRK